MPCGRCPACLRRRQNEWAIRIQLEARYNQYLSYFITLTYEDENLHFDFDKKTGEKYPCLSKSDLQKFFKRFRKKLGYKIRYFACGEYGDTFDRPHYHAVVFGLRHCSVDDLLADVQACWHFGFATASGLTIARSKYVAKYCCKQLTDNYDGRIAPFAVMSLKPAIGKQFLSDKHVLNTLRENKRFFIYDEQGIPYNLPRYFRNRIFSKSDVDERNDKLFNDDMDKELYYMNSSHYDYVDFVTSKRLEDENFESLYYKRQKEQLIKKQNGTI